MSGVGGIVGTSKVLLIASTAGLLAVALVCCKLRMQEGLFDAQMDQEGTDGGRGSGRFMGQARESCQGGDLPSRKRQTFCFLRLQLSHALAVRCLFSGSTLGRVIVWGRRRIGCVVSCFLSSHRSPLMRSNWVEWGGGRVRNSLGARIVEDDEKKMIHLNTLDRGKHGRCDY